MAPARPRRRGSRRRAGGGSQSRLDAFVQPIPANGGGEPLGPAPAPRPPQARRGKRRRRQPIDGGGEALVQRMGLLQAGAGGRKRKAEVKRATLALEQVARADPLDDRELEEWENDEDWYARKAREEAAAERPEQRVAYAFHKHLMARKRGKEPGSIAVDGACAESGAEAGFAPLSVRLGGDASGGAVGSAAAAPAPWGAAAASGGGEGGRDFASQSSHGLVDIGTPPGRGDGSQRPYGGSESPESAAPDDIEALDPEEAAEAICNGYLSPAPSPTPAPEGDAAPTRQAAPAEAEAAPPPSPLPVPAPAPPVPGVLPGEISTAGMLLLNGADESDDDDDDDEDEDEEDEDKEEEGGAGSSAAAAVTTTATGAPPVTAPTSAPAVSATSAPLPTVSTASESLAHGGSPRDVGRPVSQGAGPVGAAGSSHPLVTTPLRGMDEEEDEDDEDDFVPSSGSRTRGGQALRAPDSTPPTPAPGRASSHTGSGGDSGSKRPAPAPPARRSRLSRLSAAGAGEPASALASGRKEGWRCSQCTLENEAGDSCAGCGRLRGKAQWACLSCTYHNVLDDPVCAVCNEPSPFFGDTGQGRGVTAATRRRVDDSVPGPSQGDDEAVIDALLGGAAPTDGGGTEAGPGKGAGGRGEAYSPAALPTAGFSAGAGAVDERGKGRDSITAHAGVEEEEVEEADEEEEEEEEEEESSDDDDDGMNMLQMARKHAAVEEPDSVVDVTAGGDDDGKSDSEVVFVLSQDDYAPGVGQVGGGAGGGDGEEEIEEVVEVQGSSQPYTGNGGGGSQQPTAAAMARNLPFFQTAQQCSGPIQYSEWFGASSRDTKVALSSKIRTEAHRVINEARRRTRKVPGFNGPADAPSAMERGAEGMSALQLWIAAPPSARRSSLLNKRGGKGRRGGRRGRGRKR